jgi:hypothetical protein
MTCEICFEVHPFEKMRAPRCGHYFCETCWTGQVLAHHYVGVFSLRMFIPNSRMTELVFCTVYSFLYLVLITSSFSVRGRSCVYFVSYTIGYMWTVLAGNILVVSLLLPVFFINFEI